MKYFPVFFIFLLFLSLSCKKDDVKQTNKNSVKRTSQEIEEDINVFLTNLENPENVDPMSVEDVVWNIEAALNYKYSNAYYFDWVERVYKEVNMSYNLNNENNIDFTDIVTIYNDLLNSLREVYYSIDSDEKILLWVDIEANEDESFINMKYSIAVGNVQLERVSFGSTDYWFWGEKLGKCGSYSGNNIGYDAATELQRRVNYDRSSSINLPITTRVYFTDLSGSLELGGNTNVLNLNDQTPQDNFYDYYLLHNYQAWPNYHECLSPTEMKTYYDLLWDWKQIVAGYPINSGKTLYTLEVASAYRSGFSGSYVIRHGGTVGFGIENWTSIAKSAL